MNRTLLFLTAFLACAPPTQTPPASLTSAAVVPSRPEDVNDPMAAVMWTLNYDLRRFDEVWAWLHEKVPAGAARARAISAATLLAVFELDRDEFIPEGLIAFDEAIAAFPEDDRLPLWRAMIFFVQARDANDSTRLQAALTELRNTTQKYRGFTLFGLTLSIGGWEDASPELLEEARTAFADVVVDTAALQHAKGGVDLSRSRRLWDTPIAPFNIPAMQAMIGDLALRAGKPEQAAVAYFTALRANGAARWPWRAEVERRLGQLQTVMAGFQARPATEWAFGSQHEGSMGVPAAQVDTRFGGRLGNGSCTVCHTHVSVFDAAEAPARVGWVRGKIKIPTEVPNLQPIGFLLPDGKDAIPAGFGIGPFIDAAAPRDFDTRDELFDGTFLIPAEPGTWFVALRAQVGETLWQGHLPNAVGAQWFLEVKEGQLLDVSEVAIELKPVAP